MYIKKWSILLVLFGLLIMMHAAAAESAGAPVISVDGAAMEDGVYAVPEGDVIVRWTADPEPAFYSIAIENSDGEIQFPLTETSSTDVVIPFEYLVKDMQYILTIGAYPSEGDYENAQWAVIRFSSAYASETATDPESAMSIVINGAYTTNETGDVYGVPYGDIAIQWQTEEGAEAADWYRIIVNGPYDYPLCIYTVKSEINSYAIPAEIFNSYIQEFQEEQLAVGDLRFSIEVHAGYNANVGKSSSAKIDITFAMPGSINIRTRDLPPIEPIGSGGAQSLEVAGISDELDSTSAAYQIVTRWHWEEEQSIDEYIVRIYSTSTGAKIYENTVKGTSCLIPSDSIVAEYSFALILEVGAHISETPSTEHQWERTTFVLSELSYVTD